MPTAAAEEGPEFVVVLFICIFSQVVFAQRALNFVIGYFAAEFCQVGVDLSVAKLEVSREEHQLVEDTSRHILSHFITLGNSLMSSETMSNSSAHPKKI